MAKNKSRKERVNVVYSTNPDFGYDYDEEMEDETLSPSEQLLKISLDKKARKGKSVTLVDNFEGTGSDLLDLSKTLKSLCGVGGSVKDGQILIQGDHREKVITYLEKEGYRVKKLY